MATRTSSLAPRTCAQLRADNAEPAVTRAEVLRKVRRVSGMVFMIGILKRPRCWLEGRPPRRPRPGRSRALQMNTVARSETPSDPERPRGAIIEHALEDGRQICARVRIIRGAGLVQDVAPLRKKARVLGQTEARA